MNKKSIIIPRIITPKNKSKDMHDIFNLSSDLGNLFWQNWLLGWKDFLTENKKHVSAVRLSRGDFEDIDGYIYIRLDVSICWKNAWYNLQTNTSNSPKFDVYSERIAPALSQMRAHIRECDLHVLSAESGPHANGEEFMHKRNAVTEYTCERFVELLNEVWGDEKNLVQEDCLRELVPPLPPKQKQKL